MKISVLSFGIFSSMATCASILGGKDKDWSCCVISCPIGFAVPEPCPCLDLSGPSSDMSACKNFL